MRASYIRQGQNAVGSSVQGKSFKEGVGLSLGKDHSTGNGNPLPCSCLENPRDGEPGGLPYMGSHRIGHD